MNAPRYTPPGAPTTTLPAQTRATPQNHSSALATNYSRRHPRPSRQTGFLTHNPNKTNETTREKWLCTAPEKKQNSTKSPTNKAKNVKNRPLEQVRPVRPAFPAALHPPLPHNRARMPARKIQNPENATKAPQATSSPMNLPEIRVPFPRPGETLQTKIKMARRARSTTFKQLKTNNSPTTKMASPLNANPFSHTTPLRYHKNVPPVVMPGVPDILARIVSRKREELLAATTPLAALRDLAEARTDQRDFPSALRSKRPAIISEIKKASPSKGVLIEDFQPAELALKYQQGGAVALSVLTDRDFFQGSLKDLQNARAACHLPVLRKDFTISEYHVYEAAAAGADAILLIVAILEEAQLRDFRELAECCGMACLIEAHDAHEVATALRSGAEIIGINNRDLRSFTVSLDTSVNLAPHIPANVLKVSESGIFQAADIRRLMDAGFDAFLVGEHLVKSGDATRALQELVA